ncbi:MAG: carboxypeptidase regulatory-like domain-containing protein [Vicinamibacterales bacterium]
MTAPQRVAVFLLAAGLGAAACSAPPPPAATDTTPKKSVDPATAGAIAGRASFEGARPPVETLNMGVDQACVQSSGPNPQSDAVLISDAGGLQNVFVYIKSGLDPGYGFETPTEPVVLDQKGCIYRPRVLGIRVGQPLQIVNDDPTMHNVHALPTLNQEFNKGQPMQGMRETQVFTVPEVPVRFMCNVHNWMAAYVGVVAHPFFAVTDADGRFELKGVPPGTYTLEAWHEKFGTQEMTVTIAPSQSQPADFTFRLAAGG